jgi:hypothetical protein
MPGLKALTSAAAFSADGGSTWGLDASSTTTIGVPVVASASSKAVCAPKSSSVAVLRHSPISGIASPTTATTTSAARASATAWASSAASGGAGLATGGRGWPSSKLAPSGSSLISAMSAPRA